MKEKEKFYLTYKGVRLSNDTYTREQANDEINNCVRNYGYRPLMHPVLIPEQKLLADEARLGLSFKF
jgi:histidyl-tRNA synthetase